MAFIRSANPIWFFVDHVGLPLNDEYYAFFMQNTLPYLPQVVYEDPDGNIPWSDPIELQPSGTLPDNLYFDDSKVYRIEIRHGNTQAAELIWLIENYIPGGGSSPPIPGNISINTENVISNPQFGYINFVSPFTTTLATFEIAPGWTVVCAGSSGSVTVTRIEITGDELTPTNPPYALEFVSSGWTGIALYQTFLRSGALWTGEAAAMSFTAKGTSTDDLITGKLVYSDGSETLIISDNLTASFKEYSEATTVPASASADLPAVAYTRAQISWTSPSDVSITSIQLVGQDTANAVNYEQVPLERQLDHLFHYYKQALVEKPKASILSGWNFSLNPFQFITRALTTFVAQTGYIADQTIIHQLAASTVQTGQSGVRGCLQVKALNGVTNNRFALIQYVVPQTIKPYWSYILSSLARTRIFTTHGTQVGVKMRLIWRLTIPSVLSPTEPIASWVGTDPVFGAGWTAIAPLNDPTYILLNSYDTTEGVNAFPAFSFDSFQMPDWQSGSADTMTLGVVIYTTANMNSTLASEDNIQFDRVSLVPNNFAVDSPPQTADQVRRECQFFYRTSFLPGTVPAVAAGFQTGESYSAQNQPAGTAVTLGPIISFDTPMWKSPDPAIGVTLYNPVNADNQIQTFAGGSWALSFATSITANGFATSGTTPGGTTSKSQVGVHWTADARPAII